MIGELLTVQEAAKLLDVKVRWIRERIRNGSIRHFRDGNIIRISKVDLEEYLESSSTAAETHNISRPKRSSHGVFDRMVKDALVKKN